MMRSSVMVIIAMLLMVSAMGIVSAKEIQSGHVGDIDPDHAMADMKEMGFVKDVKAFDVTPQTGNELDKGVYLDKHHGIIFQNTSSFVEIDYMFAKNNILTDTGANVILLMSIIVSPTGEGDVEFVDWNLTISGAVATATIETSMFNLTVEVIGIKNPVVMVQSDEEVWMDYYFTQALYMGLGNPESEPYNLLGSDGVFVVPYIDGLVSENGGDVLDLVSAAVIYGDTNYSNPSFNMDIFNPVIMGTLELYADNGSYHTVVRIYNDFRHAYGFTSVSNIYSILKDSNLNITCRTIAETYITMSKKGAYYMNMGKDTIIAAEKVENHRIVLNISSNETGGYITLHFNKDAWDEKFGEHAKILLDKKDIVEMAKSDMIDQEPTKNAYNISVDGDDVIVTLYITHFSDHTLEIVNETAEAEGGGIINYVTSNIWVIIGILALLVAIAFVVIRYRNRGSGGEPEYYYKEIEVEE